MPRARLIFADGVDGAGKTYKLNQIFETFDPSLRRFRSSYQIHSKFAGLPVNLETSMEHDWRILHDFITQVCPEDQTIFVDRGFLSSYVYSKVIRKTDLSRYLDAYLDMFSPMSEFWIFIRDDHDAMEGWEQSVDYEFRMLYNKLVERQKDGKCCVRLFTKTSKGKFKTEDFLDLNSEIVSGRIDADYYERDVDQFIFKTQQFVYDTDDITGSDFTVINPKPILCIDCDGTIMVDEYPQNENAAFREDVIDFLNSDKYGNLPILLITGRTRLSAVFMNRVMGKLSDRVSFIYNNRNLGLSSRVLKEYVLHRLSFHNIPFDFVDDREDVMKHLFSDGYTKNETLGLYIKSSV